MTWSRSRASCSTSAASRATSSRRTWSVSSELVTRLSDRPVSVGVVGLGYWGPNLARNFAALDGCELRWCCDADPDSAAQAPRPAPASRRPRRAAVRSRRLDAIVLATDVPSHARLAIEALRGRQALLRREAAGAVAADAEAAAVAEEAVASGRVLMVGHLLEYHPGVAKLKDIVDSGELGDVRYVYSQPAEPRQAARPRRTRSGASAPTTYPCSSHLFDGEEPDEAVAHGRVVTCGEGVEDVVFCYLRFPSGLRRAHAPLVARPAQGAAVHGGGSRSGWRPSTTWRWSAR